MVLAQLDVEPAQRLVEQEAGGVADDRAADRDALLLALGELAGLRSSTWPSWRCGATFFDPLGDLGLRQAVGMQREGEVLAHRQGG